uniref:KOW domain-containing protein n=1 Tax=Macrostomum lignano TaxID=282301 RepID=A0A1I8JPY6_9PLAT
MVKVNDTIRVDLATGKIIDFVKFEPGNLCMITGGANTGRVGVITHKERHPDFDIVHVKDSLGHTFATRESNVFVIGKGNQPWVSLPRGKGVKLSIAEERDRRLAVTRNRCLENCTETILESKDFKRSLLNKSIIMEPPFRCFRLHRPDLAALSGFVRASVLPGRPEASAAAEERTAPCASIAGGVPYLLPTPQVEQSLAASEVPGTVPAGEFPWSRLFRAAHRSGQWKRCLGYSRLLPARPPHPVASVCLAPFSCWCPGSCLQLAGCPRSRPGHQGGVR